MSIRLGRGFSELVRVALLLLAIAGVARASEGDDPRERGRHVPASVRATGEHGEQVYAHARAGEWKAAVEAVEALKAAARGARVEASGHPLVLAQLDEEVARLARAVEWKDRRASMDVANGITLLIAELAADYRSAIPLGLARMDVLVRDLELFAQRDDDEGMGLTVGVIRGEWNRVVPKLEPLDREAAGRIEALIVRLERSDSLASRSRLTRPLADEIAQLEARVG